VVGTLIQTDDCTECASRNPDADLCQKLSTLKKRDAVNGIKGVDKLCRVSIAKMPDPTLNAICTKLLTLTDAQVKRFMVDITQTKPEDYYLTHHVDDLTVELVDTWVKLYPSQFEQRYDYLEAVGTVMKQPHYYKIKGTPQRYDVTLTNKNGAYESHLTLNEIAAKGGDGILKTRDDMNQLLNLVPLLREVVIIVDERYEFTTDLHGRVSKIEATLQDGPERRNHGQQKASVVAKDGPTTPRRCE
jgi:hypothetical protein